MPMGAMPKGASNVCPKTVARVSMLGHIDHVARGQLDLLERLRVAAHVALGFGTAIDQIEGKARDPAFARAAAGRR